MVSSRWLPMVVLGVLLTGCQDWPYFEYAPLPDFEVSEVENGEHAAQTLGVVESRTIVYGEISTTGTAPSTAYGAFGFDEWYTGDIDYYAFSVLDLQSVEIGLQWGDSTSDLDIHLFEFDSETAKSKELVASGDGSEGVQELIHDIFLFPEELYILVVAGRNGPPAEYTLVVDATAEG